MGYRGRTLAQNAGTTMVTAENDGGGLWSRLGGSCHVSTARESPHRLLEAACRPMQTNPSLSIYGVQSSRISNVSMQGVCRPNEKGNCEGGWGKGVSDMSEQNHGRWTLNLDRCAMTCDILKLLARLLALVLTNCNALRASPWPERYPTHHQFCQCSQA